jgi:pimeloyl-ACP methyl ester carboxylesterase
VQKVPPMLMASMLLLMACTPLGTRGFQQVLLPGGPHRLAALYQVRDPSSPLVVYFEGDGNAFLDRHTPSGDPTPERSLVKALMARDPHPNLLYLPRPCQFVTDNHCSVDDWTLGRYSEEMVQATHAALMAFARQQGMEKFRFVGFSGGGAIALLVAAREPDRVLDIRTIAGNLDTRVLRPPTPKPSALAVMK